MSCFTPNSAVTATADLDPTKHVNYTPGMILGVDDFTQEFAYLAGRDRWLARDLIGYGTVSGLSVRVETDAEKGPRVMIAPGVALNPRGQFICVPAAQCAYLNQWLAANEKEVENRARHLVEMGSPPIFSPPVETSNAEITLYVTLCYRDCLTDKVPIPGEPCRSDDELAAPSRVKDDFQLELRFEPPAQREEDAVRDFVAWLRQIEINDSLSASTPLPDFLAAIRDAATAWFAAASPPTLSPSGDFMFGSPPIELHIHPDDVCEYMRAAFRLWVTELRNIWNEKHGGCCVEMTGGRNLENCILLAELRIPLVAVSPGWRVSDVEDVVIDEQKRPFVVHLRMLQEWLLCGSCCAEPGNPVSSPPISSPPIGSPPISSPPIASPPVTSPPVSSPPLTSPPISSPPVTPPNLKLDDLADVTVPEPEEGHILIFRNNEWISELPVTREIDHGSLSGLGNDDHQQYLLADGSRALGGNLSAGNNRITNLAQAAANGEAVVFEQAVKQGDAAGGDLSGTYPNPTVRALRGRNIATTTPQAGNVLTFTGSAWTPQALFFLPLATITRLNQNNYEIWFNIDAPDNMTEVVTFTREHLRIFGETATANFLEPVLEFEVNPGGRNSFNAILRREFPKMRFNFDLSGIRVKDPNSEQSLLQFAQRSNIRFLGHNSKDVATIFVSFRRAQ